MRRRIGVALLAAAIGSPLLNGPPAQALLEPVFNCFYVYARDIVNQSTNTWIASGVAYAAGVPTVHQDIRVTCWLLGPAQNVLAGTAFTCVESSPGVCFALNAPTTFVSPPGSQVAWCIHVVWLDTVTNLARTLRPTECGRSVNDTGIGNNGTFRGGSSIGVGGNTGGGGGDP